jgi:hypothetical protein
MHKTLQLASGLSFPFLPRAIPCCYSPFNLSKIDLLQCTKAYISPKLTKPHCLFQPQSKSVLALSAHPTLTTAFFQPYPGLGDLVPTGLCLGRPRRHLSAR